MTTSSIMDEVHETIISLSPQTQHGPPSEERAHGNVSMKTYYGFFRAGGNFLFIAFVVIILIVSEVMVLHHLFLSNTYYHDCTNIICFILFGFKLCVTRL